MNNLIQDLKYAVRVLRKSPGFTAVAVLVLALGIGANTTIFGLVYSVLLQPLPYPESDRLVSVSEGDSNTINATNVSYGSFADWQEQSRAFSSMAAYRDWGPVLDKNGETELLRGLRVSSAFFATLGIAPALGRDFNAEEDRPNQQKVVSLSHGFWQRQFGGDRNLIGQTIRLGESSYTVIGVLPADFRLLLQRNFNQDLDLYAPLAYDRSLQYACRTCQHLQSIARLAPGISLSQARSEMNTIRAAFVRDYPAEYPPDSVTLLSPLQTALTGKIKQAFYLLLGAVALVLLIACANIANLLLARGVRRRRELAVRAALGAARGRIVRQLLTESVLLGLLGGGLGILLTEIFTRLVVLVGPSDIPRLSNATVQGVGLLFATAVSLIAAILFGLLPALQITRVDLSEMMKDGQKGSDGRSGKSLRDLLVVAELAIALVLLVGSGLLLRSLSHLLDVNPGFDSHSILTINVSTVGRRFNDPATAIGFFNQVIDRTNKMPGVESVGMVNILPISGGFDRRGFHIQDRPLPNVTEAPSADRYVIDVDYLKTLRIPLKRGREFNQRDKLDSPLVALINETTARLQWPGEDPIGKQIQLGGRSDSDPWITIVGIVSDVHHYGLDAAPTMQAYVPFAQDGNSDMTLLVRSKVTDAAVAAAVRQAVSSVEKGQLVYGEKSMETVISSSLSQRKFTFGLLGAFTVLALVLALVGVYGVMAYTVEGRSREFGIRLALGARAGDVVWLVLKWSLRLILVGLGIGLAASMIASRLLTSLLFEVQSTDVLSIAGGALVLVITGLFASYLPARRAGRIDPMNALGAE